MNCLYNLPAKTLNDTKGIKLLKNLCPEIKGKTCCSTKQLISLTNSIQPLYQFTARCPACWNNLRKLYCQQTCSPDQSVFMNPLSVGKYYHEIEEVEVYVSHQFKEGLFNSCKDVIFPGANEKVLNLICGTTADQCTPQKLLVNLGNPDNGAAPFKIDYPTKLREHGVQWDNIAFDRCNETFFDLVTNRTSSPCSCQDCHASCPIPPPVPIASQPRKILGMDVLTFAMGVSYITFLLIFLPVNIILSICRQNSRNRLAPETNMTYTNGSIPVLVYTNSRPGPCERLGGLLEGKLRKVFTWWGVWCSHHPFVVMGASVVVIAIFACGLFFFHVTTDPVELWSSPTSEARREKDIFDTKFSPFYRTEQIIVRASHPNITGYVSFPHEVFVPFGPIFKKSLMNKVSRERFDEAAYLECDRSECKACLSTKQLIRSEIL